MSAYTLCFAALGATVSSGTLDWGDGQTANVGSGVSGLQHQYANSGSYTLTLHCSDSAGNQAQATAVFTVTGTPKPTTTAVTTTTANPAAPPAQSNAIAAGQTILLGSRSRTSQCTRGWLPDPRCSPGAYDSGLTQDVICAPDFRTSSIRNVSESEKHDVEIEYGMTPRAYGRSIEIDHIVSLELGGSNDVANLFPEPGTGTTNYHVKDKLENRLHALVCSGQMSLTAAQRGIASNWQQLYHQVFGATQ